ncbi:MAG: PorV/PorQ family protein [Elusimicrobia bacterium]|nr:PorV/PorQ family protein [Elusimicrobiota bacterium]
MALYLNSRRVLLWAGFFLCYSPAFLLAQGGGQPAQFMSYGAGARALSMGGAFFAIADDSSASYWNPAGLSLMERKEITAMQASLFVDTSLSFLTYAHPTATNGTFALNITQLKSAGFEKVGISVNPNNQEIINIQNLGTFDNVEQAIGFAWGRTLTETLSFGIFLKNITRKLDSSQDSFRAVDISALQRMGSLWKLAVGVQNVFSIRSGDTDDKLPLTLKVGNAVTLFKGRFGMGFDLTKPQQAGLGWRLGGEYWLMNWFGIRFGLIGTPQFQETDFGFGLKYRSFGLDIAQGIHDLGSSTRFSATFRFGHSNKEKHDVEVRKYIQAGFEAFRQGQFAKSMEKFSAALYADPGNKEVTQMVTRLQTMLGFVPEATGGEEIPSLVRRGVITYVEGKDLKSAVNALRHAFNKNSRDDKVLTLLNFIEKEAGISEITRKPEGPEIFTLVDQKIYDARQAIYDGKYDLAIRRAQDVVDLEPNNETAWEIMGSAFFLMDQKEKAKAIWKKVLEINPNNKVVQEFLKQLE